MRRVAGWLAATLAACAGPAGVADPGPVEHLAAPAGALGPYSGSVAASGRLVFAAGKVGRDRADFAAEVGSAIDAVEAELGRHDLGLADVVSVTVHLTDIADYAVLNAVYAARFPAPYPARTCVAVAALPGGARVEITATAVQR